MKTNTHQYFYCHQHGVTIKFPRLTSKILCTEGKEPIGEGFPRGKHQWFTCSTCKTFWQEHKDHYAQCPACKLQALKLYQCQKCNTVTIQTTKKGTPSSIVQLKSIECYACLATLDSKVIRQAHLCNVLNATIFTTHSECKFCGDSFQIVESYPIKTTGTVQLQKVEVPPPPPLPIVPPISENEITPSLPVEKVNIPPAKTSILEIINISSPPAAKWSKQRVGLIAGVAGIGILFIGIVSNRHTAGKQQLVNDFPQAKEEMPLVILSPSPGTSIPIESNSLPLQAQHSQIPESTGKILPVTTIKNEAPNLEKTIATPRPAPSVEKKRETNNIADNNHVGIITPPIISEPQSTPIPIRPTPQQPTSTPTPIAKLSSGTIRLSHPLEENEQVDLGSQLPGMPVMIESVEPQCCVGLVGRPSPSNGWKKLVVRSTKSVASGVTIRWRLL
jgi:hypothetical protein